MNPAESCEAESSVARVERPPTHRKAVSWNPAVPLAGPPDSRAIGFVPTGNRQNKASERDGNNGSDSVA